MITTPTVLILGAGASVPYGFPSGASLRDKIYNNLQEGSERFIQLRGEGFEKNKILKFREDLLSSQAYSIDAFLGHRPEYEDVGKAAIVQELIPLEDPANLQGNWYQFLFHEIGVKVGFDHFHENAISIITFNYDRSLEEFLFRGLKGISGKSDQECIEKLIKIPIIHIHGKMGDLWLQTGTVTRREYITRVDEGDIARFSRGIKIVHENVDQDPEIQRAREFIGNAKKVYILGLGYDPMNLRKLELNSGSFDRKVGVGTFVGKTVREIGEIRTMLGVGLENTDHPDWDVLKLLRERGF
ncbi:MAG: hypothetical protein WCF77_04300 [Minisyncoccia bacterium]